MNQKLLITISHKITNNKLKISLQCNKLRKRTETNKISKIKSKFDQEDKKKEVEEVKGDKRTTKEILIKEDIKSVLLSQNMKRRRKKKMMIQVQA